MNWYTEEDLKEEMERVSKELFDGEPPRQEQWKNSEIPNISQSTYHNRFGTWNKAKESCGFPVNEYKHKEEELFQVLKDVSKKFCDGGAPRQKDINLHTELTHSTYTRRFGSWNEALIEAGFEPNRRRSSISEKETISKIKEFSEESEEKSPSKQEFLDWVDFSGGVLVRFGGWNQLLRKSGLRLNNCKYASEEEMLEEIEYISENHAGGKTPSTAQMDEYGQFSSYLYKKEFDGWNTALEKAGYEPNYYPDLSEEEALDELKKLNEDLGRVPTVEDLAERGKVTWEFYKEHFGSYIDALEEVGLESAYPPQGEDHVRWKGGYGEYYGPNWRSQRKKTWERDNFKCRVCAKDEEEIGRKPDVHHIEPKNNFNVKKEYEQMNKLDNLISLCRTHHVKIDGKWKELDQEEFEKKAREYFGLL